MTERPTTSSAPLPRKPRRTQWRSYDELLRDPAIQQRVADEFPDLGDPTRVDRRSLMRLMGASLGLAGLTACGNDQPFGAPLYSQPTDTPGVTAGEPVWYATTLPLSGLGRGALVKTVDGRPIKIEGNPAHPASLGGSDVFMQADVLSLYDPGRSAFPVHRGKRVSWKAVDARLAALRRELREVRGAGAHILLGPTSSPTVARLLASLRADLPELRVHVLDPLADVHAARGAALAFGRPLDCVHDFTRADFILSLGHDFLGPGPAQVRYAHDWAARRRAGIASGHMPRLVVAETSPTLTGAQADRRLPLAPSAITGLAHRIAAGFGLSGGRQIPAAERELVAALRAAGPRGLVLAGRGQPPEVHALAHLINDRLGAVGTSSRLVDPVSLGAAGHVEDHPALVKSLEAGSVRVLLVLGCNPAYVAPADFSAPSGVHGPTFSLHLGEHKDETAAMCDWHLPAANVLESWGDLRAFDGTASLQQPATAPVLTGRSAIELLSVLAGEESSGRDAVRRTWTDRIADEPAWRQLLESGVLPGTAAVPADVSRAVATSELSGSGPAERPDSRASSGLLEVSLVPDATVWDGSYSSNAWLQELPDPVTKIVWGNAALISPDTARARGLAQGDLVRIAAGSRQVRAPIWITPGQAAGAVTLSLGHGRRAPDAIAASTGESFYGLRAGVDQWSFDAEMEPLSGRLNPINTQQHHDMSDRDIVLTMSLAEATIESGRRNEAASGFYPDWPERSPAWGMVIDLDSCIGCSACTIACQAENNIPVVGPEEVARGREMHWIRVDRYYDGEADNPSISFMPVPCMHCESAPCEVVCPVNATVHSNDGLNQMVYNRCIGTRTCSNNCPYKVRRFNYYDYADRGGEFAGKLLNPVVTVRERGVMEKCTYCVQRIRDVERGGERSDRSGLKTACQQACPSQAITFGDLADPNAPVSRRSREGRNYSLLEELNTKPRTTYLARIARGQSDGASQPAPASQGEPASSA